MISQQIWRQQRVRLYSSAIPSKEEADNNTDPDAAAERRALETKIQDLHDGDCPINLASPRQISNALYGTNHNNNGGSSRAALQKLIGSDELLLSSTTTNDDDERHRRRRQRELAILILQYKELVSHQKRQQQQNVDRGHPSHHGRSMSTLTTAAVPNNNIHDGEEMGLAVEDKEKVPMRVRTQNGNQQIERPVEQANKKLTSEKRLVTSNVAYQEFVHDFFHSSTRSKSSQVDEFWKSTFLEDIQKPSARQLLFQLDSRVCPMGYAPPNVNSDAGKKGSLLAFVRDQKRNYSDCVILTRVGDFYEAFGLDAVLLVEFCGLNPMGGKARAGCPVKNVQQTLDCLTAAGLRVAVIEEAADTDAAVGSGASGGSKSRLKHRMLAQIVSSASPTYLFDLVLGDSASAGDMLANSPSSRPHVGIISTAAGYTIVEVSSEERSVRITERVTAEAVACRLAAYPPADPLFYVPTPGSDKTDASGFKSSSSSSSMRRQLPFLPSRFDSASSGPGSRVRTKTLSPLLMQEPAPGICDLERAKRVIVSAHLDMTEDKSSITVDFPEGLTSSKEGRQRRITHEDFVMISSMDQSSEAGSPLRTTQMSPLYVETATQLGLLSDPTIPPLISYLLPESAPAPTRRFLRRWLLAPPPSHVSNAMSQLVQTLKDDGPPLPPLAVPPIGKVLALIRAGQASAQVFRELVDALESTTSVLDAYSDDESLDIVKPLMILLQHESGMAADPVSLKARCRETSQLIEEVVAPYNVNTHNAYFEDDDLLDRVSDHGCTIPRAFFERNEASWRGRVKPEAALDAYDHVEQAVDNLANAVRGDFWGPNDPVTTSSKRSPVFQDIFNNLFALKEIPSWVEAKEKEKYFHPRDRNGKVLRNRYTTANVQAALSDYVEACETACKEVTKVLTHLSETLCDEGHLPAVVQAAHANLILSTAAHHAANSNALGWSMAQVFEKNASGSPNPNLAGNIKDIWPYWMDRHESVANSFKLDGLFLLTAPNMSGKSTLMRSTAAAALLSNCGLCAPLAHGSSIQRFDALFVRGASADVPTEGKSAFGAEMGDIAALIRSCGDKSLVFVDELGRGTSPKDGTSLAGAVLEAMAESRMNGIFATHLHGILDLPLSPFAQEHIFMKRMAIHKKDVESPTYEWTYRLEDGVCKDSLALVTARHFGLPENILNRAEIFSSSLVKTSNPKRTLSPEGDSDTSPTLNPTKQRVANGASLPVSNSVGLDHAMKIVEEYAGENEKVVRIPPKWMCPASLEGCCCVYILQVGDRFYVGETDSISRRLSQHRKKGSAWTMLTAVAIRVQGGKTEARNIESLVIRKMAKIGFDMISINDGRSVRSKGRMLPNKETTIEGAQ